MCASLPGQQVLMISLFKPSRLTDVPHEIILSVGFVAGLKSQNMVLSGDIRSIPLLSEVCIFFDMAGPDWWVHTSTPCTEETEPARVPSGPPLPSLADNSMTVRQFYRDQTGHALTRSEYRKCDKLAKQRAVVLKLTRSYQKLPNHLYNSPKISNKRHMPMHLRAM